MEGISKISYKGKEIIYVNYDVTGSSKEKQIALMNATRDEYVKCPPKSALGITNVTNLKFDKEIAALLKQHETQIAPHQKKVALVGMKPVHQALFNFGFALSFNHIMKVFKTEDEAKEWLVSDN